MCRKTIPTDQKDTPHKKENESNITTPNNAHSTPTAPPTPIKNTKVMYLLWAIRFLSLLSGTIVSPSVRPMLTHRLGITNFGFLQSASNGAALITATIVGRMSDARGSRLFAIMGGTIFAALGFICLFVGGLYHYTSLEEIEGEGIVTAEAASVFLLVTTTVVPCMGRVLQMTSQSVLGGITQAAASDLKEKTTSSSNTSTGKNIALVRSAIGFGVAAGAALGGRLVKIGTIAPLMAGLVCTILNVGVGISLATSASLPSSTSKPPTNTNSMKKSLKLLLTELLTCGTTIITLLSLQLLCSLAFFVFTSTWDITLMERIGYDKAEFSYLVSVVGWLFAFVQMLIVPKFVSRSGSGGSTGKVSSSMPLKMGLFVAALGRFGLASSNTTPTLILSFAILALGQGTVGTLLSTLVARTAPTKAGYYMGLLEGARGLAGVIGPMVGAACYKGGGGRAPAAAGGIFQVVALILACVFISDSEEEEKSFSVKKENEIESTMTSSSSTATKASVPCAEKNDSLDSIAVETKKSK